MGLLSKMAAQHTVDMTIVEPVVEVKPVIEDCSFTPAPEPAPAPVRRTSEVEFKRDPGTGLIESAVGYDAEGHKVKFDFVRDGRRNLETIKVRR
jgi:hypothetical protein